MADRMLKGLQAEFGAEPCPVADVMEALHRGLLDHRRSHIVGDGVLAGTVHATKGLGFAHVVVLAGGWKGRSADYAPEERSGFFEEERRLYYVAMTRARKTLTLLDRRDASLPYARELEGWSLRRRKLGVADGETRLHCRARTCCRYRRSRASASACSSSSAMPSTGAHRRRYSMSSSEPRSSITP